MKADEVIKAKEVELPKTITRYMVVSRARNGDYVSSGGEVYSTAERCLTDYHYTTTDPTGLYGHKHIIEFTLPYGPEVD